jgi:hypothetical protein
VSVTLEKAETTTAKTLPARTGSFKILMMLPIAAGLPTEVPPNFKTSIHPWYYIIF